MNKLYVGVCKNGSRQLFRSAVTPSETSHGHLFTLAIGPFRTKSGACFMRDFGQGNPHCQCVDNAERLAKRLAKISTLPLLALQPLTTE